MPTDGLLTLMQWLSPGFPIGTFGYSHGLEQVVADGAIRSRDDLRDWLMTVLASGSGRNDAILLAVAYRTPDPLPVDALARALSLSHERLRETVSQGEAFCLAVNAVWDMDLPPLCLPVAVGAAASLRGLPLDQTLAVYLHAFAAGLVSAAQRAMPLGQIAAQQVLAGTTPLCLALARDARTQTLDDLGGHAFLADIAAMRHDTLEHRIFRS